MPDRGMITTAPQHWHWELWAFTSLKCGSEEAASMNSVALYWNQRERERQWEERVYYLNRDFELQTAFRSLWLTATAERHWRRAERDRTRCYAERRRIQCNLQTFLASTSTCNDVHNPFFLVIWCVFKWYLILYKSTVWKVVWIRNGY